MGRTTATRRHARILNWKPESRIVWRSPPRNRRSISSLCPSFSRNTWINHLEIHMQGPPHHLEFDDGTIELQFVAMRPGDFSWYVQGLESRGMAGRFVVK